MCLCKYILRFEFLDNWLPLEMQREHKSDHIVKNRQTKLAQSFAAEKIPNQFAPKDTALFLLFITLFLLQKGAL